MFLVNDDKSQLSKRQKDRRTHSYDQVNRVVAEHLVPYLGSLGVVEFRMIDHHAFAKHPAQTHAKLCRKSDFGNHHQHLPFLGNDLLHEVHVYFRFAARRNTMEKGDRLVVERRADGAISHFLYFGQRMRWLGLEVTEVFVGDIGSPPLPDVRTDLF